MRETQKNISEQLHVDISQSASSEIERRINFLVDYALSIPNCLGFVLGISGGQDSTLAGRLAQLAVERMRATRAEAKFIAVRLPYKHQIDKDDAIEALEFINPDESFVVQIENAVDDLVDSVEKGIKQKVSDFNKGNVKARMRMVVQYAIAGDQNLLVVGSDHAAEAITGFFTKFGDGAADVMPLSGLTKRQGAQMLEALGAPSKLWQKIPTADLLDGIPGESDEKALGVTYNEIDDYLEGLEVSAEAARVLEQKYKVSSHKRYMPVGPRDDWWKND